MLQISLNVTYYVSGAWHWVIQGPTKSKRVRTSYLRHLFDVLNSFTFLWLYLFVMRSKRVKTTLMWRFLTFWMGSHSFDTVRAKRERASYWCNVFSSVVVGRRGYRHFRLRHISTSGRHFWWTGSGDRKWQSIQKWRPEVETGSGHRKWRPEVAVHQKVATGSGNRKWWPEVAATGSGGHRMWRSIIKWRATGSGGPLECGGPPEVAVH